jgi:hypothetical protein
MSAVEEASMKRSRQLLIGVLWIVGIAATVYGVWVMNWIIFRLGNSLSPSVWYLPKVLEYGLKCVYFLLMGGVLSLIVRTHAIPILTSMGVVTAIMSYYPFVSTFPTRWIHLWIIGPNLLVIPVFLLLGVWKERALRDE